MVSSAFRSLVLAGFVCLSAASPSLSQTPEEGTGVPGAEGAGLPQNITNDGWKLNCREANETERCAAQISLREAQRNQQVLRVQIQTDPRNDRNLMVLQMPLGLFLPAGAELLLDDRRLQTLPIQTCNQQGCFATKPLSEDEQNLYVIGETLSVVVQDLRRRRVQLQVPLAGLSDMLNDIK
ncbi:MAG: invasion associated locus B family protein [Pseudomonadota bacterium]